MFMVPPEYFTLYFNIYLHSEGAGETRNLIFKYQSLTFQTSDGMHYKKAEKTIVMCFVRNKKTSKQSKRIHKGT